MLGISRKLIYYQRKQPKKDQLAKKAVEDLHKQHPAYGHRRVGLALGWSYGKALRVMRRFDINPPRRKRRNHYITKSVSKCNYTNLIKDLPATEPHQIYCSDLTYIRYKGQFVYLATIEDIFTREIVSAGMSDHHDSALSLSTIKQAVTKQPPVIFHSDQGSEFMAGSVTRYLEGCGIQVSVSDKGSPWQNGYKESFYGKFKLEVGDLNRFGSLGEMVEEVYSYINYHNKYRIHTKLKMPPLQFKQNFLETVSQNVGT